MKVGDKVRVYRKVNNVKGCSSYNVGFTGIVRCNVTLEGDPSEVFIIWNEGIKRGEMIPKTALAYAKY